jgi:hypothetical protein
VALGAEGMVEGFVGSCCGAAGIALAAEPSNAAAAAAAPPAPDVAAYHIASQNTKHQNPIAYFV